MRLIDADKLLESIANSGLIWETNDCIDVIETLAVKKIIDDALTVEERPKGKWIEVEQDGMLLGLVPYYRYNCSECGYHFSLNRGSKKPNYCQECGADMRGEEHGTDL